MLAKLKVKVPETKIIRRQVWNFKKADWTKLKDELREHDWSFLQTLDPSAGIVQFTEVLRSYALDCIGKREIHEAKSTHPWMTEKIVELVAKKHALEGTAHEKEARDLCSQQIVQTKTEYVHKTKEELKEMQGGSKQWWKTMSE